MRIINKQQIRKSMVNLLVRTMISIGIAFTFVACGGDSGGGGGGIGPGPGGMPPLGMGGPGGVNLMNCPTCSSMMVNPLPIGVFDSVNMSGTMNFNKMQIIVNGAGFTPGYSSIYNLYSGPVAIQGQLIITSQLIDPMMGSCVVPPGQYTVQTVNVGTMAQAGLLQIPELVSMNGAIRMRIMQGILYKNAATQMTRLFGHIYITSVNGIPCSTSFSDSFN